MVKIIKIIGWHSPTRPGLAIYGKRLMNAEWCYDELDSIAKEWREPIPPPDYNEILIRAMMLQPISEREKTVLDMYKQMLEAWPRYDDYKYLKKFCDALFDHKAGRLEAPIYRLYFG